MKLKLFKNFYKFIEKLAYRRRLSVIEEALKLKRSIIIKDEWNFIRPINVSVVIPTFLMTPEDLYGYRYEVIRDELIILDQLLSKGLIDEVIVVDGSRSKKAGVDDSLAKRLILSAYRRMVLFHDQVDMLNKFPALKDKAKLGFYDFVFKIIHQLDFQVSMIAKQLNILPEGIPIGKGAAIWLGVGVSSGDIIVFLDSDIKNLEEWQIASLIKPLLKTFKDEKIKVELTKAYYTRLSVNIDSPEKGFYKIGGRVTRLFLIPLLKVLSRKGFLSGLEKLKYPLSGEFAGKRSFIESLSFSANYSVETGILIELWKKRLLDKIIEVDLNLFQHFPRSDEAMNEMVKEITQLLLYELKNYEINKEEIVNEYLQEAYKTIEASQGLYDKAEVKTEVNHKVKRTFYKDVEGDKKRVVQYAKVLNKELTTSNNVVKSVKKMPSWMELTKTLEGQKFQSFLRRKAVAYTLELLSKNGVVKI
ncbi:MAG: hypothetical protein QXL69_02740 [Candidatus Bathyarchaeia archaeon]|nr:hypothetical protein [Candidatus Bathyarchaeota archaeon]